MEELAEKARGYGLIILAHLAVILSWHLFVVWGEVPSYVMPTPAATVVTLASPDYHWLDNTLVTAGEIFGGYALGVLFGVSLALIFSWVRILNAVFFPLFVSLNMIPKVALGPLFIVWFSYGLGSNIIIAFSICFFPILLTTARGLTEIEPDLIDLVRSLRASRWQIFTKIQLPGALPYVFSGMKVGAILAVAGAVVGEFIASDKGLGYLMIQVQSTLDTAAMFMAVILLSLVGISLYLLVTGLERICVVKDARLG
ncbi:MAG: ABC transporter permease [Alphaproteobacteria bacterium]|nr:ABC transporter permease [Alphaproteobacteria bacterium]MDP6567101.1 ABC transporter permease [Alphaproteobacteria bacterium]MDP6813151.1 ABC transporter permease [Alphaproteobacteria bacterium]